jgi:hypothetical protein
VQASEKRRAAPFVPKKEGVVETELRAINSAVANCESSPVKREFGWTIRMWTEKNTSKNMDGSKNWEWQNGNKYSAEYVDDGGQGLKAGSVKESHSSANRVVYSNPSSSVFFRFLFRFLFGLPICFHPMFFSFSIRCFQQTLTPLQRTNFEARNCTKTKKKKKTGKAYCEHPSLRIPNRKRQEKGSAL